VADLSDLLAGLEGFQWDLGNSGKNLERHKVTDSEAEEAFFNQPVVVVDDTRHSVNERRFVLHGVTNEGRGLTVIFTTRGTLIRVISARDMSRKERRAYEKAT
jgi:uncharacterized DUF497 family protein